MWREKLYEAMTQMNERDAETLIAEVKESCDPWLRACGRRTVWRGMRDKTLNKWFTFNVRTNRRPMDSSNREQEDWNRKLNDDGCTAQRHNSLFVSGDSSFAHGYGIVYAVFPVGPFYYSWSNQFRDASGHESYAWHEASVFKCDDGSLIEAIDSGNEIMIKCRSAICIPTYTYYHNGGAVRNGIGMLS